MKAFDFWFLKIHMTGKSCPKFEKPNFPKNATNDNIWKIWQQNERDHKFDLRRVKSYRLLVKKIDMRRKCGNWSFRKYSKCRKDQNIFRKMRFMLEISFLNICICRKLYESSRRKPGWRFTAGFEYRIPGDRKLDFRELFFNSFWFKMSRGRLWHHYLLGSVLIDGIWRSNEIEELDRSSCKKVTFFNRLTIFLFLI